jgi:flagellar biosynthesis/type III secretory pathway protein FliH
MKLGVIKSDQAQRLAACGGMLSLNEGRHEARQIVLAAHAEAQRILSVARAQAAAELEAAHAAREAAIAHGRAEGIERGRSEGFDAGRQTGLEEIRSRFEQDSAAVRALLESAAAAVSKARAQIMDDASRDVLVVALAIAQRLWPRLPGYAPDVVVESVRRALAAVRAVRPLAVRVHPADVERIRQFLPTVVAGVGVGGELGIVADESIARGGAVVDTVAGSIDAALATQFERIADELVDGWREHLTELSVPLGGEGP